MIGFRICLKDYEWGILLVLVDGLWWKRMCPGARHGMLVLQVIEGLTSDWNAPYEIIDVDPYRLRRQPFYQLGILAHRDADATYILE